MPGIFQSYIGSFVTTSMLIQLFAVWNMETCSKRADKAQALPEYLALTEDQQKQLLHNADIKGRISHYLDLCGPYWECYWDAVSKAAQDILQDYQQASPQK